LSADSVTALISDTITEIRDLIADPAGGPVEEASLNII
jgi:hypothetical protein